MTHMRDTLPHRGIEEWKWSDLRSAVSAHNPDGFDQALVADLSGPTVDLSGPAISDTPTDPMGQIAAEYSDGVTSILIPAGATLDAPLELCGLETGNARFRIEVGEGASLDVIEHHSAQSGFANVDLTYIVRDGATLRRTVRSDDGAEMIRHVRARVTLWDGAKFHQTLLTFGGALTRLETRIAGMGAVDATLSGAYLLDGERHADVTNYIDFAAPGSVVRDAVAGVVTDKGKGVFQGKFHVRRPAQETDAEMRHDALMLSETAKINAKPELEIYADDVECAHGNTIGQLDENALFYMRQRGIPDAQARAMLLEAFIAARLGEDEGLLTKVRAWLDNRI